MPQVRRAAVILLSLLLWSAPSARAQLQALRTEQLNLVHFGATRYLVPHVARCFENAYEFHHETFGWTPSDGVTLLVHDFYDHGNAAASSVPRNNVMAAVAPFSYAFDIIPGNEHINWLLNHELVHVLASDMAAERDRKARALFHGKVYPSAEQPLSMAWSFLTSPRLYSPGWYHEGIAAFMETWMAGGLGRAQSAYDEMAYRTMVLEGRSPYDLVGLETAGTTKEFQVGANAYLYGTRFMTHLADHYGPEKLIEWVARTDGTKAYFSSQFEAVYGRRLADEWSDWIDAEIEFQQGNLSRLRQNPITAVEPLGIRALGSVSRPAIDREHGKVYLGVSYPGRIAHLGELDLATGALRHLVDLKGAALFWVTSIALDPESGTLFYVTDNNDYRDLNALDLATGTTRRLQTDSRVGDLAFDPSDRALWGVRHFNGISTLVRIPPPYDQWKQVHSFPYGNDLYSLDVSPDGMRLSAALTRVDGTQSLVLYSTEALLAGKAEPESLGDFENSSPADFVFSPDGRFLYGSSYYSGVSNLYRYDFESGDIEPLSNVESGLFRPVPIDDRTLFALEYTADGFRPVRLPIEPVSRVAAIEFYGAAVAERRPMLKTWNIGSPAEIDLEARTLHDGPVSILGSLELSSVYPIVEGYKDAVAGGVRFDFRDPVGLARVNLDLSYSSDPDLGSDEDLHATVDFAYLNWRAGASWNRGDFYDLFGPTKRGRKGWSIGGAYERTLILDEPHRRLDARAGATAYGDLDTLPGNQNVPTTADRLVDVEGGLHYKSIRNSLGSVDSEEGVEIELVGGDTLVSGDHFPQVRLDLDAGVALPIEHSSLWLRTSFGAAFGDRDDPFGNSYFGGFRNNWVDHLDSRRYRTEWSFPGFEIDEIAAHRFGKALLEWNLPPIRPRFGSPAAHVNWISTSLFGGYLVAEPGEPDLRREYTTAGIQIDTRFTVRTHLAFTLSVGAAVGREVGGDSNEEFLVSLQLPVL